MEPERREDSPADERYREPPDGAGESRPPAAPGWGRYAGMGVEFAAAFVGLTLLGIWIDRQFGSAPVGVLSGALLGIVGGLYNFIRQAIRLMREQEAARKRESGGTHSTHDRQGE